MVAILQTTFSNALFGTKPLPELMLLMCHVHAYCSDWWNKSFGCSSPINSLRPRPNRRPFADDFFKCIFLNENEWILRRISLKYVPKVGINNIPALVQIMAWRRLGDKPLSEPMMVNLLTHICVTRPQWVNGNHGDMPHWPFGDC